MCTEYSQNSLKGNHCTFNSYLSVNQHIRMISEGSRDTVMMLKIQLCMTGINYILKYIEIENKSFEIVIIFHNINVFAVVFF